MTEIINDASILRVLFNSINLRSEELIRILKNLELSSIKAVSLNDKEELQTIQKSYAEYKDELDLIVSLQDYYEKNPKRV